MKFIVYEETLHSNPCIILNMFKKPLEDQKESYQGKDRRVFDDQKKPYHMLESRIPEDPFRSFPTRESFSINAQNGWKETANAYVFKLDTPGMEKYEVKLEIKDNGVLCIKAETGAYNWRGKRRSYYWEIESPDSADVDKVRAEMNDGELIITVPKYQFRKPIPRVVQISRH